MAYNDVYVNTSACGAPGNLPGVAVYNPEVTCPGAGFGASTFASPATPLGVGLTTPIAKFTFASSAAARRVFFGNELSAACEALVEAEVGGAIVYACADGVATLNQQAEILCCFWDANMQSINGFVAKTNGTVDSLSANQVLFQPCNPCFVSDTDFVCINGCNDNSNFILTNAVVGANAGIVIQIPAGASFTLDVCSCAPQVNSFAACPPQVPAIAQIAPGVACPPSYAGPTNGYANGAQAFVNGR